MMNDEMNERNDEAFLKISGFPGILYMPMLFLDICLEINRNERFLIVTLVLC